MAGELAAVGDVEHPTGARQQPALPRDRHDQLAPQARPAARQIENLHERRPSGTAGTVVALRVEAHDAHHVQQGAVSEHRGFHTIDLDLG